MGEDEFESCQDDIGGDGALTTIQFAAINAKRVETLTRPGGVLN
jgi:hypothetical protein